MIFITSNVNIILHGIIIILFYLLKTLKYSSPEILIILNPGTL